LAPVGNATGVRTAAAEAAIKRVFIISLLHGGPEECRDLGRDNAKLAVNGL
jgi:hypothetical protein